MTLKGANAAFVGKNQVLQKVKNTYMNWQIFTVLKLKILPTEYNFFNHSHSPTCRHSDANISLGSCLTYSGYLGNFEEF